MIKSLEDIIGYIKITDPYVSIPNIVRYFSNSPFFM